MVGYAAALTEEIIPLEKMMTAGGKAAGPIQVLLVEDDAESAVLVQMHLNVGADVSFSVEWTTGIVEATIRLADPGIDVILLDLGLPEFSGALSYRAIEIAAARKLPVVIFTSDDREATRDQTMQLGASDYLLKQDTLPVQLKRALRKAVVRGRVEPESGVEPEGAPEVLHP